MDLSGLDTSGVTNMVNMFSYCTNLTTLDLSKFNTSSVTDMGQMFQDCSGLTTLDLSSFNTSSVTGMTWMFIDCTGLTTIIVGTGWNTENVTYSWSMFWGCRSLAGGSGTKYDEGHTDAEYAHIDGGTSTPGYLSSIPVTA